MKITPYICFLLVLGFLSQKTNAQDTLNVSSENTENKWSFLIEPYLMFPNMNGTSGLGALPDTSVDAKPSDIFNNLQIGTMVSAEASKGPWHIATDFIYMNLKYDIEPKFTVVSGNLKAKQLAFNVSGFYSILPWLDLGIGGNLNSLKIETNVSIDNNGTVIKNSREKSQTWFDPMIIARTQNKPNAKLIYQIRADIGGFGIGSDFAYQLQFYAGYRFSKLFQLTGGYRIIGIDYEKKNTAEGILNNNRFLYDMSTFGPVIRLGFNF